MNKFDNLETCTSHMHVKCSFILDSMYIYSKFGNFRENFVFANSVKILFATLKIHDLGMIYKCTYISKRQYDCEVSRK